MRHSITTIVLCFVISIAGIQAQMRQQPKKAKPFNDVSDAQTHLKHQEKLGQFSGAVLVIKDNKTLINDAYGFADKDKKLKNTTNTKFNIGSINKAFTAVCIMQLVDNGRIHLDDKIKTYIPELTADMTDEITIRHLLEMTSGLGSYWDSKRYQKTYKKLTNLEDYLPIITAYPLSYKPGTKRQYSNSGYELLGILVERVSGKNYYQYVKENVYKKAGMTDTDAYPRNEFIPHLAQGYSKYDAGETLGSLDEGKHPYQYNVNGRFPNKGTAAGGGYSTLNDLQKFVNALFNNRLLSETSTTAVINHFRNFNGRNPVYIARGGSIGINADVFYNNANKVLILVLSNYDPPTASNISRRLQATFSPKQKETTSNKTQIMTIIEQFKTCIQMKDLEQFQTLFVNEDKVSWVGNGTLGKQFGSPSRFIKMLQSTDTTYREDFHNVTIWNDDHIATVMFDYGFFGNDHLSNWGKESWMLIKQEGKWKITAVNYSMILPHEKTYPFKK